MKFAFAASSGTLKKEVVEVEFKENDLVFFTIKDGRKIMELGIGKREDITRRKLIILARKIIETAKNYRIKKIAVDFNEFLFPKLQNIDWKDLASLLVQNFVLANYEFNRYKTEPKEGWKHVEEVTIISAPDAVIKKGVQKGIFIGEEINACRELANIPGGEMTPPILAQKAKEAAKGTKVSVKILGKKEMTAMKMGAVLGVAQGSVHEPQFIILEYKGGGKDAPVVLVGKGVTFDSGGLSLKPSDSMLEMHMDMSGGAAVIHAVTLAAKLELKKNIVGLVPAVENMPSGSSYRPGDILKSLSGKTIEVLNTDAEGRVILADALTYAEKFKPRLVVDVATLTGASLIALGEHASAIMTPDQNLETLFRRLGEESGDYVWPLPLWEEYEENIKGNMGDISNIPANGNTRYGGVINGGMFLYQFAKNYPWVHIDMAPRMTPAKGDRLARGATGAPTQLLIKLLEEY